jgi:replicative DNA helicase
MAIEQTIINNLVYNEEYTRKVLPFLKEEYFSDHSDKVLFQIIENYVKKYNSNPSIEAVAIDLSNKDNVNEQLFNDSKEKIKNITKDDSTGMQWLLDETEKFCQDKAIYNAIMQSIQIINNQDEASSKGSIPTILSDALSVCFDSHIGHDFIEDYDGRYDFYHKREDKIPFNMSMFNNITKGGLPKKSLNVILAGTGVGKSLFMCHCASSNIVSGYNVLYITMEMAEERIAERIDQNLLDITTDDLRLIPKEAYNKKISKLKANLTGKLIVKEYPTACAGSANFRHLLGELKLKKNFVPDIIYIDYINICMSSRLRYGSNVNSYTYIKAIAEELRGLAVEFNVPIVTATQTTRSGYSNSDVGLEDTSESFGLPATADLMFALIASEELDQLGQIMVKQLKNRYNDPGVNRKFVIGVDRGKMRLYDVEQSAQQDIIDDRPAFDKSSFGSEDFERGLPKPKFSKEMFVGFK